MIIWTVDLLARPGQADAFASVAEVLSTTSRAEDAGCHVYVCLRHPEDASRFLWYEQWADEATLRAHVERVRPLLGGAPRPGATLPPVLEDTLAERVVTAWEACGDPARLERPWPAGRAVHVARGRLEPGEAGPGRLWHRQAEGSGEALLIDLTVDDPGGWRVLV